MEKISLLQSEPTPEPIIEIEKPTMHPLLQAMQELREEGVIDEYINKDTVTPDFTVEKEIQNGYILKAQGLENGEGIKIKVFDPENVFSSVPIADATFKLNDDDKTLTSSLTTVHHKYQKQGIARAMYQFVHDLGNDIQASKTLLPGGQRMWDAFGSTFNNEPEEPQSQSEKKSLWQRLFKEADAIDEEIAYHGTTDDIAEFYPLSHFGTEKAAKDRMTYKKIKDGKIYKVDLNIKNPLTIKDFPGIHYDRLYAFELRDKKLISQKEMEAITTIDDKAELRKALLTKLKELGIDGFVYKNKYEDKGNLSYVIVDPSQVKVLSVEPAAEEVTEASPDTLEGSFTPDLVESKTWLAEMLAKGLKGKNAGTIYVLGSWYGNMGIFLQQAGVKFDKLVLVEPDEEALMRSKDLLQQIGDEGKLILIHQKAEDAVYEKPGVVINTSCNETGPVFLTKLPDNMLCLLQARNNNENTLFPTEDEEDFIDYFPLEKVYYTGKKQLEDPEVNYVRYMKIGRTGKKLDEEFHTGGSLGLPFPGTYEQEYDMFKSKGPRRITAMTNESEKSFPNIVDTIVKNIPNVNEIYFHGSRAIGKGKRKSDWDILVIVDDSVVGRDYINTVFALQNIAKKFKNFDIQPSHKNNNIARIAKEEGKLLYSANQKIDEALDSSYEYLPGKLPGIFYFDTEDGQEYKVEIDNVDNDVTVAFSARGQGDEHKTGITGTGNSRKIFGTVIKIVKDYIRKSNPGIIAFSADNSEPSRVRLYKMLASQANKELPNYNFTDAFSNGGLTTYYLTRDGAKIPTSTKVKAKAGKALDAVFEGDS